MNKTKTTKFFQQNEKRIEKKKREKKETKKLSDNFDWGKSYFMELPANTKRTDRQTKCNATTTTTTIAIIANIIAN